MKRTGRQALIGSIGEALTGCVQLDVAYVYGSVARGTATPISDVDVAVLPAVGVEPTDRGALLRDTITRLERNVTGRRFQVHFLDELPIAVRGRVMGEGVCVLDRNARRRVREEVNARMLYHDFLHFEREGARQGLSALRREAGDG